ncbi:hypothetical protein EDD76_11729 [Kineothrix alysoides]|uniref:Uncharacterized protein n=1 Tax=Kineothrix alysoides TaxID=1469948 RepID=A0A4R1QVK2_9FIRM|nr:hypothetical protein [Kineothrix alysoides]TCL54994.1 hypothetical protein EDD76_11729 [Kineothrix alysoides]
MENKKRETMSMVALVVSILPLVTLILTFLNISLSDEVRTICAGGNIIFVLAGLILSIICVKSSESRSTVNIISMVISSFWALLMVGIVAMALLLNFLQ